MRKLATPLIVVVACVGVVTFGGAQRSEGSSGRTLRLFEHDAQNNAAGFGNKLGEPLVWSGDLFDRKGGRHLGRMGGLCSTAGTAPHGDLVCHFTYNLPGGQIAAQALWDTAALLAGKPVPFAITGGTGIYRGAHGEGTEVVLPGAADYSDSMMTLKVF